jgi:hypothetical protein
MSFTVKQFRHDFPEFKDELKYTSNMVTFWSTLGGKMVSEKAFGNVHTEALSLFVAHNLALQAENIKASSKGGVVGAKAGQVASKSVGSVSVSYDTASSALPNAGHWNMSTYGKQYVSMMLIFGAGGLVV